MVSFFNHYAEKTAVHGTTPPLPEVVLFGQLLKIRNFLLAGLAPIVERHIALDFLLVGWVLIGQLSMVLGLS